MFDSDPDGSETDSTSSDEEVGGLGKFSHGKYGLVHQHWVWQVICAGAFSVHNTEGPEAHHNTARSAIVNHGAYGRQRHLFGKTVGEQDVKRMLDRNAHFCLLEVDTICHVVHMAPVFVDRSTEYDYRLWLQTVTAI